MSWCFFSIFSCRFFNSNCFFNICFICSFGIFVQTDLYDHIHQRELSPSQGPPHSEHHQHAPLYSSTAHDICELLHQPFLTTIDQVHHNNREHKVVHEQVDGPLLHPQTGHHQVLHADVSLPLVDLGSSHSHSLLHQQHGHHSPLHQHIFPLLLQLQGPGKGKFDFQSENNHGHKFNSLKRVHQEGHHRPASHHHRYQLAFHFSEPGPHSPASQMFAVGFVAAYCCTTFGSIIMIGRLHLHRQFCDSQWQKRKRLTSTQFVQSCVCSSMTISVSKIVKKL